MKRKLFLLISIMLIVVSFTVISNATESSGSCGANGDNIQWSFNSETGVLTLSGNGEMGSNYPWQSFKKEITRIEMGGSITSIGHEAFKACTSLSSIEFPDSLISISGCAFYYCYNLKSVEFPDSLTLIGGSAFDYCNNLESVSFGNGIKCVQKWAFSCCTNISYVNCSSLESWMNIDFDYDSNPTQYAKSLCVGGKQLTSLVVPTSITSIKDYAFINCSCITSVSMHDNVTSIGSTAFRGCNNIGSITMSKNVSEIGAWAFSGCSSLVNVTIPAGVKKIRGYTFFGCYSIEIVSIPESVLSIESEAFGDCTKIKKVFYEGDKTAWDKIEINTFNNYLTGAQRYYYSTSDDYYLTVDCCVSTGGAIYTDKKKYKDGETVTIIVQPYNGFEFSKILVDGTEIDGLNFTASNNHTVSAVFTLAPGGTPEFRINGITVSTFDGAAYQTIPEEDFLATVSVTGLGSNKSVMVMLAKYDIAGRYNGLTWMKFSNIPNDSTIDFTLPVSNENCNISHLKAFIVESFDSVVPVGNTVSFSY